MLRDEMRHCVPTSLSWHPPRHEFCVYVLSYPKQNHKVLFTEQLCSDGATRWCSHCFEICFTSSFVFTSCECDVPIHKTRLYYAFGFFRKRYRWNNVHNMSEYCDMLMDVIMQHMAWFLFWVHYSQMRSSQRAGRRTPQNCEHPPKCLDLIECIMVLPIPTCKTCPTCFEGPKGGK